MQEFMLLYFSLTSARIFFRYDAPDQAAGAGALNGHTETSVSISSGNAS